MAILVLRSVEDVNHAQKQVIVDKVRNRFGDDLSGRVSRSKNKGL